MYELIPDELKAIPHWICWRAEPDPKSHSGIKKIPVNPKTGKLASTTNPETWADFQTACAVSPDYAGIGFVFKDSGYFGIDIDDRPEELAAFLQGNHDNIIGEMVDTLQTYTELSQSGNGIHIICLGHLPGADFKNPEHKIEMYQNARYFVMTGNMCAEYADMPDCTQRIIPFYEQYRTKRAEKQSVPNGQFTLQQSCPVTAQEIIEKIRHSAGAQKFNALYAGDTSGYDNDNSAADLALCNILAFWCSGDAALMDEIFRTSGLMRAKWDRPTAGSTYGRMTIQTALDSCNGYYSGGHSTATPYSIRIGGDTPAVQPKPTGKLYTFDDTGNAQRFFDAFGEILRFSYIEKKWMYYHSGKWFTDNVGYIRTLADHATALQEQERVRYTGNEDMLKAFERHLKKSRSFNGKTNMIREAEHYAPILPQQLDKNRSVIGVKNGIIDLRTGKLHPHDRGAYITKQVPVCYNPDAPEPRHWLQFLDDIFAGDPYMLDYIQKCVGYSLTGSTAEQCAFFLCGVGSNGKSTFLEIVRGILGDYATNIQPQTIMVNPKSGNAPTSDIARLKGARLVTSVEPNEGMRLDEGLLKQLTGGDVVTARKMFSEEFEFKPEFKIWIATNYKPYIRGTDEGIWRRIHLIPFEVKIPEAKVDKHLKYKLVKEAEGILKWAVQGCLRWQNDGLTMPPSVQKAVKEYRHEMDVISAFMDACCVSGGEVKASQLYAVYAKWADDHNEVKMSCTKFGTEMAKRHGIEKKKNRDGWFYSGISLGAQEYCT